MTLPGLDLTAPCDAGCHPQIHTGPHWLHMDHFDREEHRKLLAVAIARKDAVLLHHVAQAELRRLAEKERQLRALGLWTDPQPEETQP